MCRVYNLTIQTRGSVKKKKKTTNDNEPIDRGSICTVLAGRLALPPFFSTIPLTRINIIGVVQQEVQEMTLNRKWLPGLVPLSDHNEPFVQKETNVCIRDILISETVYKIW